MPSSAPSGTGRILGGTIWGAGAALVEVQADVRGGLPVIEIVGLPDRAVSEAARRVRTALANTGYKLPPRKIVINLAPADLPKRGASLDLAIAAAIATALGQIAVQPAVDVAYWGQVSLDGAVQGAPGLLPFALALKSAGSDSLVISRGDIEVASLAGLRLGVVDSLADLRTSGRGMAVAAEAKELGRHSEGAAPAPETESSVCLLAVVGLRGPMRCLEIAAAGGHHLVFLGPMGIGKSLLARGLHALLPAPDERETLELASIASLSPAGWPSSWVMPPGRPLRTPLPGIPPRAMLGGGSPPRLGEVSLAHHGVLVLDELAHFRPEVLVELAEILSRGTREVPSPVGSVSLPARFLLAATSNYCLCGQAGGANRACTCAAPALRSFRRRLSPPLLDRIDMHIEVAGPEVAELEVAFGTGWASDIDAPGAQSELSPQSRLRASRQPDLMAIRSRIAAARHVQAHRYGYGVNARAGDREFRAAAAILPDAARLAARAGEELGLSPRAVFKVLRVARTIADLAAEDSVAAEHVAEALSYRTRPPGAGGPRRA